MYADIEQELTRRAFPVRYAATAESVELKMFNDLVNLCKRHSHNTATAQSSNSVEIDEDGLLITFNPQNVAWVRIQLDNNDELLYMIADPVIIDVVWIYAAEMDWISFIGMMLRPRPPMSSHAR